MSSPQTNETILLVAQNELGREILGLPLHGSGFRLVTASDGPEAVETAKKELPDLILMDVNLPKLDGIGTTRRLREQPELSSTPIVIVSAFDTGTLREAALWAGCNEFLTKPVAPDRLRGVVARLLSRKRHPKR